MYRLICKKPVGRERPGSYIASTMRVLQLILILITTYAFAGGETYILITYHFKSPGQQQATENFIGKAWMPGMHRAGIRNIGVFRPIASDTALAGKRLYVLFSVPGKKQSSILDQVLNDPEVRRLGADYLNARHDQPPYVRMEITMMKAFEGMPKMAVPGLTGPRSERIYELRSYEGPTELRHKAKVRMFNAGDEIGLFKTLGFNAVFYADVFAGNRMPNLMYMTTFANMAERDQLWKAFFSHPHWKHLLTIPEYQNSVSKADIFLLQPTDYSDF